MLLAETRGDTAEVELREHNPFAPRNMVTSTATLPIEGVPLPSAAGSLLTDPRRARKVLEELVSSTTDTVQAQAK